MRLVWVSLFAAFMVLPLAGANGCTPCECGVAACHGDAIYWPEVEWVSVPSQAAPGEPFEVTYRAGWAVTGTSDEVLDTAVVSHLAYGDLEAPASMRHTVQVEHPMGNVTLLLVWPEVGNVTLHAFLPGAHHQLGQENGRWAAVTDIPVRDQPSQPHDEGAPALATAILLPLLVGALVMRRRAP